MKHTKGEFPQYGFKIQMTSKISGRYVIMRQDYIDSPILNPETLSGKLLWFTTESGYSYNHPKSRAKQRAKLISDALNKTDEQLRVEAAAPEMLEMLQYASQKLNDHFGHAEAQYNPAMLELISDINTAIEKATK